jgi:hypothetical protein
VRLTNELPTMSEDSAISDITIVGDYLYCINTIARNSVEGITSAISQGDKNIYSTLNVSTGDYVVIGEGDIGEFSQVDTIGSGYFTLKFGTANSYTSNRFVGRVNTYLNCFDKNGTKIFEQIIDQPIVVGFTTDGNYLYMSSPVIVSKYSITYDGKIPTGVVKLFSYNKDSFNVGDADKILYSGKYLFVSSNQFLYKFNPSNLSIISKIYNSQKDSGNLCFNGKNIIMANQQTTTNNDSTPKATLFEYIDIDNYRI